MCKVSLHNQIKRVIQSDFSRWPDWSLILERMHTPNDQKVVSLFQVCVRCAGILQMSHQVADNNIGTTTPQIFNVHRSHCLQPHVKSKQCTQWPTLGWNFWRRDQISGAALMCGWYTWRCPIEIKNASNPMHTVVNWELSILRLNLLGQHLSGQSAAFITEMNLCCWHTLRKVEKS